MKHRYQLISLATIFVILAGVYILSSCVDSRHEGASLLLYVTTLPDLSHSIAVLDPSGPTCSESTFVDTTIKGVESVRWSSDRERIEFVTSSPQYITNSLWVIEPDGSNRKQIIPSIPVGFGLEWVRLSHDQHYVAYRRSDAGKDPAQWEIDIVDTETGAMHQLMTGIWTFEWAPTNNLVAVSRWRLNDSALYIVQPDGAILGKYRDAILSDPYLSWSPDSRQVAFSSSHLLGQGRSQVAEIYAIDINGGQKVQLTHGADRYEKRLIGSLSWSPDGSQIAFVSHHTNRDGTSEGDVLFVVDVQSGHETRLANDVEWSLPVWSPDSKKIAFVSTIDGSNYGQIYLADVTLGTITQLTCDDRMKESLSW
jgi:Tol biopolymer transport system component